MGLASGRPKRVAGASDKLQVVLDSLIYAAANNEARLVVELSGNALHGAHGRGTKSSVPHANSKARVVGGGRCGATIYVETLHLSQQRAPRC